MRGASCAASGCCSLCNDVHGFRSHLKQVHDGFDQSGVERFDYVLHAECEAGGAFSMCVKVQHCWAFVLEKQHAE